MVVKIYDFIVAEGSELELGIYSAVMLSAMADVQTQKKETEARKAARKVAELMDLSFLELMKREQENGENGEDTE